MLEFTRKENGSQSRFAALKGSEGYSVVISMPIRTPFGVQHSQAVKNLTDEEAMELRDHLNKHYPINYSEVVNVDFIEVDVEYVEVIA